jgi:NADPH:quinone reductase-like Zn-dependent oxidoreductase
MKAAIFRQHGGPEVIEIADVPAPEVATGYVRVAVHAAAMNHLDLWARRGLPGLQLDFPHIGGSDIAGVIEGLGDGVDGLQPGARVLVNPSLWCGDCEWCKKGEESLCESYSIIGEHLNGGFAEYVSVPAVNVLPIPDELSFQEAAAVPLVKHLGARVLAVTSGAENVRRAEALGADLVIDRLTSSFSKEVWNATSKRGVDLVFDSVGEAVWPDAVRALARKGRLVVYGATTGPRGQIDVRLTFWKQLQVIGTTMSSRAEFNEVMSLVFEKVLEPVIDVVLPLDDARAGHERLEAGQSFGKIVFTVRE